MDSQKAFPNFAGDDGNTALHFACQKGFDKIVKALLEHGCDPNCSNKWMVMPIHIACILSTTDCADKILAFDKKVPDDDEIVIVEAKDFDGCLPLHYALGCKVNTKIYGEFKSVKNEKLAKKLLSLEKSHSKKQIIRSIYSNNNENIRPITLNNIKFFEKYIAATVVPKDDDLKIQIASDLHIEYLLNNSNKHLISDLIKKPDNVKYLALLGDVGVVKNPNYKYFLKIMKEKGYDKIILVVGNHEYYKSSIKETEDQIEAICSEFKIHWLKKEKSIEIEGIMIVGDTLWSKIEPNEEKEIKRSITDYSVIKVVRFVLY